jgi:protein-L-isoaspartate(D-aspartate) O-methyltransferase
MPVHQLTTDPHPITAPPDGWRQVDIEFVDWACAATTTARTVQPLLHELTSGWWFLRKHPRWRIRYRTLDRDNEYRLGVALDLLGAEQVITAWHPVIYEPETLAFGGERAMELAHDLFCHDSGTVLEMLSTGLDARPVGRTELSLLAVSRMLRAAGLDWFEQGDVWARVVDLRRYPGAPRHTYTPRTRAAMHRLLTLDTDPTTALAAHGPLTPHRDWLSAYHRAGVELAELARTGRLERGLRAVLAHHVLFHWNRLSLDIREQHGLAAMARDDLIPTGLDSP